MMMTKWIIEVSFDDGKNWTQNNERWYVHIEAANRDFEQSVKQFPENSYRILECEIKVKVVRKYDKQTN